MDQSLAKITWVPPRNITADQWWQIEETFGTYNHIFNVLTLRATMFFNLEKFILFKVKVAIQQQSRLVNEFEEHRLVNV